MHKPIRVDIPYPSTEGISEDPKAAAVLSSAYAGSESELTAVCQYVYHHFWFGHLGREDIASTLEDIAITEMMHFDILGSLILKLGVNPVFTANPPRQCNFFNTSSVKFSTTPQKMVMDDIAAELDAIRMYESILSRLENEQVAAVIQRIILDEKLHVETLTVIFNELINESKRENRC